jgi:hypothetical protein
MFEIATVLGIVGVALVFLVRHVVRGDRGTAACSVCACGSQVSRWAQRLPSGVSSRSVATCLDASH